MRVDVCSNFTCCIPVAFVITKAVQDAGRKIFNLMVNTTKGTNPNGSLLYHDSHCMAPFESLSVIMSPKSPPPGPASP